MAGRPAGDLENAGAVPDTALSGTGKGGGQGPRTEGRAVTVPSTLADYLPAMWIFDRLRSSALGRALVVACVILITVLSLLPGGWQARTVVPGPVEHFIAYSGTGLILALVLPLRLLWPAAAILAAWSGVMELLQHFSPGRDPAVRDFLVSSAGAFVGTAVGWILFRRRPGGD